MRANRSPVIPYDEVQKDGRKKEKKKKKREDRTGGKGGQKEKRLTSP